MAADQTAVVLMWRGLMIFKPLQHIPDRNQDKSFWDMIQTEEKIETCDENGCTTWSTNLDGHLSRNFLSGISELKSFLSFKYEYQGNRRLL